MDELANIINLLRKKYSLTFHKGSSPFYVLISTIISQRNTDKSTYPTAQRLFRKYKTIKEMANANIKDLEKELKSIGLYKTKSKRIKKVSNIILKKYKGKVPDDMEKLLELPGVGRKTANCVLVYGFRKPALPVDVHVNRISNRIGLVKTKTPEQTETELAKIIPKKYWIEINELLVKHGQQTCRPITPICSKCSITKYCNYYKQDDTPKL